MSLIFDLYVDPTFIINAVLHIFLHVMYALHLIQNFVLHTFYFNCVLHLCLPFCISSLYSIVTSNSRVILILLKNLNLIYNNLITKTSRRLLDYNLFCYRVYKYCRPVVLQLHKLLLTLCIVSLSTFSCAKL